MYLGYNAGQPWMVQPAIPNNDPTATFYSIDQPTTQPTIPHDNSTSYFDPAAAMLQIQELTQALTKEQGTVKVLRATIRKVAKTNKNLHETNTKQLDTNKRQDKQLQQYHRLFTLQLPDYWEGYQKGYQRGLAEWKDTSKKNIRLRPIAELTDIAELKKSQNSQHVIQQKRLYLKQQSLKLTN